MYKRQVWILVGYFFTYLLNCWIDKSVHHEDESNPHHCACGHHDLHTAGIVLAAAVALHNLPVGLAIGTTCLLYTSMGIISGVRSRTLPEWLRNS